MSSLQKNSRGLASAQNIAGDRRSAGRGPLDCGRWGGPWHKRDGFRARNRGRRRSRKRLLPVRRKDAQVADIDLTVVIQVAFSEVLSTALPVRCKHAQIAHIHNAIVIGITSQREEVE